MKPWCCCGSVHNLSAIVQGTLLAKPATLFIWQWPRLVNLRLTRYYRVDLKLANEEAACAQATNQGTTVHPLRGKGLYYYQLSQDCQSPFAVTKVHPLVEAGRSRKLVAIGFKSFKFFAESYLPCVYLVGT